MIDDLFGAAAVLFVIAVVVSIVFPKTPVRRLLYWGFGICLLVAILVHGGC